MTFSRLIPGLFFLLFSASFYAAAQSQPLLAEKSAPLLQRPLVIVTESWAPYVYDEEGRVKGADWEVTKAVFDRLGVEIDLRFCPWKRCISDIKLGKADALLSASRTDERETFLWFPEPYLSKALTGIYVRKNSPIAYQTLDSLQPYTGGALLGYEYCPELSEPFLKLERVSDISANFQKLVLGRVDYVIENLMVGHHYLKNRQLLGTIHPIPDAYFCEGEANYLPFAMKKELIPLFFAFNKTLEAFKKSIEYQHILSSYGMADSGVAVEAPLSQNFIN